MPFATIADKPVLSTTLPMPRRGVWTASLVVASAEPLTGRQTLLCDGVAFVGTVWQGGVYADVATLRLVGGAAGLGKPLVPKFYRNAPASIVLKDLLRETGETLSPTVSAATLAKNLAWWVRAKSESAGEELSSLADHLGLNWRVLPDGTLWLGTDAYPEASLEHIILEDFPDEGRRVISVARPTLLPATTFGGKKVGRVVHHIDDGPVRTEIFFARDGGLAQDFFESLRAMVRSMLAPTLYHGTYAGRVVSQAGDGSIEWMPDDPRLHGMSGIPIELGLPGSSVKVAPETRCSVAFRNGRKSDPYVHSWDTGTAIEIKLAHGELPLARKGDMVQVISSAPGTPAYGYIVSGRPELKG